MKKENASVFWTVALYLALSTICVTANKLYRPYNVEAGIAGGADDKCEVAYRQCKANNQLSASPGLLVQNNKIGEVSGKADYTLSFDITPTGTIAGWGSIVHFTNGGDCCKFGQRSPGFWFIQGSTTRLTVRIGDSTNGDLGIDTDALPLNVCTKVTLECKGKDVKLTVGKIVYTATQPTYRYEGRLDVYAGDPWSPAAKAILSNVEYTTLSTAVTSQRLYKYNLQDEEMNVADKENMDN